MKKICILGIGNAQVDAIKYCKNKGLEVFACSYNDIGPGKKLADHFKVIDIKDVEGVKEYVLENNIDFIYSVGSDIAMPTVCKVSELLNLPNFISSDTAEVCQHKYKMRQALGEKFEGNVKFKLITSKEEIEGWNIYPCILKPVDSQGQRGVRQINNEEEFYKYFDESISYSTKKQLILEEFIDGPEVSVNAFAVNGEVIFNLVSDRIVFEDLPGGIIKEHIVPTNFCNENVERKTEELARNIMKKIKIENGPAYFQLKIKNGEPKLIEVTPRLDGCHMWNLIKHYCGVDLLQMSIDHLLGELEVDENHMCKLSNNKNKSKTLKFLCECTGEAYNRSKYDVTGVDYLNWYYEDGEIVKKINGYMEKGGYIIKDI